MDVIEVDPAGVAVNEQEDSAASEQSGNVEDEAADVSEQNDSTVDDAVNSSEQNENISIVSEQSTGGVDAVAQSIDSIDETAVAGEQSANPTVEVDVSGSDNTLDAGVNTGEQSGGGTDIDIADAAAFADEPDVGATDVNVVSVDESDVGATDVNVVSVDEPSASADSTNVLGEVVNTVNSILGSALRSGEAHYECTLTGYTAVDSSTASCGSYNYGYTLGYSRIENMKEDENNQTYQGSRDTYSAVKMYKGDLYVDADNLTGLEAITIPNYNKTNLFYRNSLYVWQENNTGNAVPIWSDSDTTFSAQMTYNSYGIYPKGVPVGAKNAKQTAMEKYWALVMKEYQPSKNDYVGCTGVVFSEINNETNLEQPYTVLGRTDSLILDSNSVISVAAEDGTIYRIKVYRDGDTVEVGVAADVPTDLMNMKNKTDGEYPMHSIHLPDFSLQEVAGSNNSTGKLDAYLKYVQGYYPPGELDATHTHIDSGSNCYDGRAILGDWTLDESIVRYYSRDIAHEKIYSIYVASDISGEYKQKLTATFTPIEVRNILKTIEDATSSCTEEDLPSVLESTTVLQEGGQTYAASDILSIEAETLDMTGYFWDADGDYNYNKCLKKSIHDDKETELSNLLAYYTDSDTGIQVYQMDSSDSASPSTSAVWTQKMTVAELMQYINNHGIFDEVWDALVQRGYIEKGLELQSASSTRNAANTLRSAGTNSMVITDDSIHIPLDSLDTAKGASNNVWSLWYSSYAEFFLIPGFYMPSSSDSPENQELYHGKMTAWKWRRAYDSEVMELPSPVSEKVYSSLLTDIRFATVPGIPRAASTAVTPVAQNSVNALSAASYASLDEVSANSANNAITANSAVIAYSADNAVSANSVTEAGTGTGLYTISWEEPLDDGSAEIVGYQVAVCLVGEDPVDADYDRLNIQSYEDVGEDEEYAIKYATAETSYTVDSMDISRDVYVRAINVIGPGPALKFTITVPTDAYIDGPDSVKVGTTGVDYDVKDTSSNKSVETQFTYSLYDHPESESETVHIDSTTGALSVDSDCTLTGVIVLAVGKDNSADYKGEILTKYVKIISNTPSNPGSNPTPGTDPTPGSDPTPSSGSTTKEPADLLSPKTGEDGRLGRFLLILGTVETFSAATLFARTRRRKRQ